MPLVSIYGLVGGYPPISVYQFRHGDIVACRTLNLPDVQLSVLPFHYQLCVGCALDVEL